MNQLSIGETIRSRQNAKAQEALSQSCDVFVEFTLPEVAKANSMAALQHGAHVVIGTSGLSDADYADIAKMADRRQRGVLAVGNFALTVVLLQKFAEIAAKHIPQSATKCYSFCLSFVPARCQSLS